MGNVQVVDECTPSRVGVKHNMDEANRAILNLGKQGEPALRSAQALGPDSQTIRAEITIKAVVRAGAAAVATPLSA